MELKTGSQPYVDCFFCGRPMSGVWLYREKRVKRSFPGVKRSFPGGRSSLTVYVEIGIHEDCVMGMLRMFPTCEEKLRQEIRECLESVS